MKPIIFLSFLLFPLYLSAEFIICGEPGIQYEPEVGFDGTNFLAVWTDGRSYLSGIYGARVTQTGSVLDPGGFKLLQESDNQSSSSLAYNGVHYLVVWKFGC